MDDKVTAAQGGHAAAAISAPAGEAVQKRLFGYEARQKLLAFASLFGSMIFFSFASPSFMQTDNIVGILQATAVNGVLAIACTFVIITGGIDLSVGTLMTFCAVMAGVFLTYWGLPISDRGRSPRSSSARSAGFVSGVSDRQTENSAIHRHARHDAAAEGPVAGHFRHQADLLQRHAENFHASRRIR